METLKRVNDGVNNGVFELHGSILMIPSIWVLTDTYSIIDSIGIFKSTEQFSMSLTYTNTITTVSRRFEVNACLPGTHAAKSAQGTWGAVGGTSPPISAGRAAAAPLVSPGQVHEVRVSVRVGR